MDRLGKGVLYVLFPGYFCLYFSLVDEGFGEEMKENGPGRDEVSEGNIVWRGFYRFENRDLRLPLDLLFTCRIKCCVLY